MVHSPNTHRELLENLAQAARQAYRELANTPREVKDVALRRAAILLREHSKELLDANSQDLTKAKESGVKGSFLDRLQLNQERIEGMAAGLESIADLEDPVGRVLATWTRPNGLQISRVAIPLGVIGIIYESRPNVTADAAGLCLKSGNAALLRCGSDSVCTSSLIAELMRRALADSGLSEDSVILVPTQDREAVGAMLKLHGLIDVIVPRGGRSLVERVVRESRVPTFEHLDGNCHTYLHAKADPQRAVEVVKNAKLRRTGICGATESLVVDREILNSVLPALLEAMPECEFRGDAEACSVSAKVVPATEEDWGTEYLAPVLSVKTVDGLSDAIRHINRCSSGHTEAIMTEDSEAAEKFLAEVDSAIVVHNASTQFADGGEFGMGAEIGISTGRLHARGPVGVDQLVTYKYQVRGRGQTRP